ncbi:MAG: tetratricopeptide repeat protein [Clostridiaceae bacterium]
MKKLVAKNNLEDEVKTLIKAGKELFENNKVQEAFQNFNEAIKLDNNYADTYLIKGEAHIAMYEIEEAEECIKTYLRLNPQSKRAYLNLIKIYDMAACFDKCIYYCDKLIKLEDENAELYFKKAEFLTMLGDIENALNCCNLSIQLNQTSYEAICLKGNLLYSLGKDKESLKAYSKAIELNNTKSDAYLEKALIYRDLGNYTKALNLAKKAYDLSPDDECCKSQYEIMKIMYSPFKFA